jgi:hypothetical protein
MKWKGLDMREASTEARAAWGLGLAWCSTLDNTTKVQELGLAAQADDEHHQSNAHHHHQQQQLQSGQLLQSHWT